MLAWPWQRYWPTMSRFSNEVHALLVRAGWHDGRHALSKVNLPQGFAFHERALKILAEFGNLEIGDARPRKGLVAAKSTICLKPSLALGEAQRFLHFSKALGVHLCPLGELDDGRFFLAIDERERVYVLELDICLAGDTFDSALETLLLGDRLIAVELK